MTAWAPAQAQDEVGALAEDIAEGSRLLLSAELGASYTDNFYFQPEIGTQEEGLGVLFRPLLGYSFAVPRFRFNSRVSGELGAFDVPGSNDDYADFGFHVGLDWLSAARHRFAYGVDMQFEHDPFGTDRTEDPILAGRELDKWTGFNNLVRYRYGLPTAPFNLEIEGAAAKREYTSNRDDVRFCFVDTDPSPAITRLVQASCSDPSVDATRTIFGTRFLDWERMGAQLTLLYNVSPKTSLLVDAVVGRVTFENNPATSINRDGLQLHYRVGARWQATARTSGDVRVGYTTRDSEDPRRENFEAVDWTANVGWTPFSFMQFGVQTGRRSLESYASDTEFIDSRFYAADWTMNWSPRLMTRLSANLNQLDFVGSDPRTDAGACLRADGYCQERQDEIWHYGINAEYRVARPLYLLGSAGYTERDSNFESATDDDMLANDRDYENLNAYLGIRYTR